MRHAGTLLLIVIAAVAVTGCNSKFKDITVATEADPKVQLPGYQSYAWAAAAAMIRDPNREWTPSDLDLGAEIMFLVDRELRKKGFTKIVNLAQEVI